MHSLDNNIIVVSRMIFQIYPPRRIDLHVVIKLYLILMYIHRHSHTYLYCKRSNQYCLQQFTVDTQLLYFFSTHCWQVSSTKALTDHSACKINNYSNACGISH